MQANLPKRGRRQVDPGMYVRSKTLQLAYPAPTFDHEVRERDVTTAKLHHRAAKGEARGLLARVKRTRAVHRAASPQYEDERSDHDPNKNHSFPLYTPMF